MTERTVTTEATGRRTETPDLATVEVKATAGADTATGARRAARDIAEGIRSTQTAVDPDRVQTTEIQVSETKEMFEPDSDERYQGLERLRIDCVPETAEAVVVDSLEAGGTVQSVEFGFHEEVRERLQDEALDAAVTRAREKAEQLARAEESTAGGVRELTMTDDRSGMDGFVDAALCDHDSPDLQPTPITVSQSVEVVYELED